MAAFLPILLLAGGAVVVAGAGKKKKRKAAKTAPKPTAEEEAGESAWYEGEFPALEHMGAGKRRNAYGEMVEHSLWRKSGEGGYVYIIRATKLRQRWPKGEMVTVHLSRQEFPNDDSAVMAMGNDISPAWIQGCEMVSRSEDLPSGFWLGPNAAWICDSAAAGDIAILGMARDKNGYEHMWRVLKGADADAPFIAQTLGPGESQWKTVSTAKHLTLAAAQAKMSITKGWRP